MLRVSLILTGPAHRTAQQHVYEGARVSWLPVGSAVGDRE